MLVFVFCSVRFGSILEKNEYVSCLLDVRRNALFSITEKNKIIDDHIDVIMAHEHTNKFMIKWLNDPMFMKPINVCRLVHFPSLFCMLFLLRLYFYELNEQKRNKKRLIHGMNEMNEHRLPTPG